MPDDDLPQLTPEEVQALQDERNQLMAERDAERRRADAESARADGLHSQVVDGSKRLATAEVTGLAAQEQAADNAVAALNTEITGLKAQQAALFAEGKFEEASDIGEKIGDATARRQQAMQSKTYYAGQRERAAAAPADPVDRFLAANPNYSAPEQQWIRNNPRYATDRDFHTRVNQAHTEAVDVKGFARFSPEYFQHLEQRGYMRAPIAAPAADPPPRRPTASATPPAGADVDVGDGADASPFSDAADGGEVVVEEPVQPAPRPAARTAAPPSRRAPAPPAGPRQDTARLTPDEAAAALAMSEYYPIEVQNGGEAEIYKYYNQLKNSPMARRKREEWAQGA